MHEPHQHEMLLEATHPSGEEEWFCPACGRRFLMHWPPDYKRVILEPGDEHATHSGAKGGLRMQPPQIGETNEPILSDEMRAALVEALKDVDLDDPPGIIDS